MKVDLAKSIDTQKVGFLHPYLISLLAGFYTSVLHPPDFWNTSNTTEYVFPKSFFHFACLSGSISIFKGLWVFEWFDTSPASKGNPSTTQNGDWMSSSTSFLKSWYDMETSFLGWQELLNLQGVWFRNKNSNPQQTPFLRSFQVVLWHEFLGNIKLYISLISPPNHHFAGPAEKKSDSNHHLNLPALEGRKRVHGLSGLPLNRKRVGGLSGLPLNRKRIHGLSILALNLLQRLPVTLKWREAFHIKKKPSKFPREETKIGRSCFHNSTLQNKTSLKSNGPCPTQKNMRCSMWHSPGASFQSADLYTS